MIEAVSAFCLLNVLTYKVFWYLEDHDYWARLFNKWHELTKRAGDKMNEPAEF